MPAAWYIVPYQTEVTARFRYRRCAIDDFSALIEADGGTWMETEVLGGFAVVKVRASLTTLLTIDAAAGFMRLPKDDLLSPLSDLTTPQKTRLRNKILEMGYTAQEISNALGVDLGNVTLAQVLRFIASRRREPRWDATNSVFVYDGDERTPRSIDDLDGTVRASLTR